MKKIITNLALTFLLACSAFAAPSKVNPEIKFVKGNIQDKIASIKEDSVDYTYNIAVKAVDFVISNMELLKDDRDFAGLAVASVYAYPEKEFKENPEETMKKFGSIFYSIKDQNVRLSVLDKLLAVSSNITNDVSVNFVNTYLKGAAYDNVAISDVEKKSIQVLSKIGNDKSFVLLYEIYDRDIWQENKKETKDALVSLAAKSSRILMNIIREADFDELKQIYSIFVENSELSATIKSELAENLLSNSMIIIRDSSKISKELSAFQYDCCNVMCQNNWTRGYALIVSYFDVAKKEFNAGFLSNDEFAKVISFVEKTSSKEAVKVLTSYLEELNKETENGNLPAGNIVSAVIQALGNLGDKSAFDCLLFTTYLNYPEEIVAQARRALSSLKW